jgi:hypothetical protein
MLFQLTTAGRTLINTYGLLTNITRVDFGDAYNYVPASDPTGLTGSVVYTTGMNFSPVAVDTNNMRFTSLIPAVVSAFTFGEVALYSNTTLIGVGASTVQIQKTTTADYRLDIYVDLVSGQRFASWEVVSSFTRNFFPRVQSPDLLIPPAADTNNAYVVYGDGDFNSAYLAFSDPSGKWSFTGKNKTWFSGTVSAVGAYGLSSTALAGSPGEYFGSQSDLVVQFVDGALCGVCRRLSTLVDGGCTWSTQLLALPAIGDHFVVLGPTIGTNFTGDHATLSDLQGGQNGQYYHLKQSDYDRVVSPHFSSLKTVSASTYSVLDTDNDTYITLTHASPTVTLDDDLFTQFPAGGMVLFRYENATVTINTAGATTLNPASPIAIPTSNGTFAFIKKANGVWDFVSTVDLQENPDANTRHKYPPALGGSLSIGNFIPMYAPGGSINGPTTDITSSPLAVTSNGGLSVWSGSMSAPPVWNSPALILIGIAGGVSSGTATGLANNTTAYAVAGTVNGTNFSFSIVGNTAQTYAALTSAFNSALWGVLGSNSIAALSYNGYGLIFETVGSGNTQSITLTTTTLFDSLSSVVPFYRTTSTGLTSSVNTQAVYLNYYDTPSNNNRIFRAGFGATVMGFQNSASGQSGYSIAGAYNFAQGNYSGVVGGAVNRVNGGYVQIVGGYGNTIGNPQNNVNLYPQYSSIVNSTLSAILVPQSAVSLSNCPAFTTINASDSTVVYGRYIGVYNSKTVYVDGASTNVSVFASQTVSMYGSYSIVLSGFNITVQANTSNNHIAGSTNVTVGGSYVNVTSNRDISSNQSSVNYLPNGGSNGAGKPGTTFQISTSAYGSSATLALTTDAGALSSANLMIVPTGVAWCIDGIVTLNYALGFKCWKVRASLKNVGGTVSISFIEVTDLGGTNGTYMTVDLAIGTGGNTDKVYFVIDSRNDTNSGYQQVSASALATVVAANALP